MRSEQGERERARRTGRHLGRAATVLVALALAAGCDDGSFTADKPGVGAGDAAPAPVDAGTPAYPQESAGTGQAADTDAGRNSPGGTTVASLPDELVGSWSGDDPQGVGSWTFEFAPDGRYAEYNEARGFTAVGQALVSGSRLYLQPNDADSQTVKWAVDGGRLSLDGNVYLRTGSARQDETALVGSWIGETNTWQTLTFSDDGTWQFDDGANGTSTGRYSVSGDQLNTGRSTYTWTVDGARLQLGLPNGQTATYSRIG
jgi:hypothetical protein